MPVGLVADVPHQFVVGGIEDVVKCHGQLHDSQAGGEMAGVVRHFVDDVSSEFLADFRQFLFRQLAQIGGVVDFPQQTVCGIVRHSYDIFAQKYNIIP